MAEQNTGKITQIIGAVWISSSPRARLPEINEAIEITGRRRQPVVEVAQHLGDDTVRCIAMGPTDGLVTWYGRHCNRRADFRTGW